MSARMTYLFAGAVLAAVAGAGPVHAEDDPETFAEQLYDTGWQTIETDGKARREWLAGGFANIVTRHGKLKPADQVGYDPLTDTEDETFEEWSAAIGEDGEKVVTVEVGLEAGGEEKTLTLVLGRTPKGLRLNDVRLSDGTSVRADMQKAVKQAASQKPGPKAKGKQKPEKKS